MKCLPNDFAIDFAIDVLPTPGGPCRHMILPFELPFLNLTARNSNILYLTSLRPVWSSCNIFYADEISFIYGEDCSHGISNNV